MLGTKYDLKTHKCKWECDRRRLDTAHQSDDFSVHFDEIERYWEVEKVSISVSDFLAYLTSWSAYQALLQDTKKEQMIDPLKDIREALGSDGDRKITVAFPFWLVLGTKGFGVGAKL